MDGGKRRFNKTNSTELWIASEIGSDKFIEIEVIFILGLLTMILFLYISFFITNYQEIKKTSSSYMEHLLVLSRCLLNR